MLVAQSGALSADQHGIIRVAVQGCAQFLWALFFLPLSVDDVQVNVAVQRGSREPCGTPIFVGCTLPLWLMPILSVCLINFSRLASDILRLISSRSLLCGILVK